MRRRLLMRDIDRVFELRKNMIDDWKYRGLDWREICYVLGCLGVRSQGDSSLAQTPY